MWEIHISDLEKIETAYGQVMVLELRCLATDIEDLLKRWNSVFEHKGQITLKECRKAIHLF